MEPTSLRGVDYPKSEKAVSIVMPDEEGAWWLLLTTPTNAAERCVIFEHWANQKFREKKTIEAGIFKRAARRTFKTIPNPAAEAAALNQARLIADDVIPEQATPREVGGYAAILPNSQTIVANAGGFQIEGALFEIALPINDTWKIAARDKPQLSVSNAEPKDVRFKLVLGSAVETYSLTPRELKIIVEVPVPRLRIKTHCRELKVSGAEWREVDGTLECDVIGGGVTLTLSSSDVRRSRAGGAAVSAASVEVD